MNVSSYSCQKSRTHFPSRLTDSLYRPPPENAGRIDNEHPCALQRSTCDVPEQLLALALMKKIQSQENSDGLVNMLEGFEPRSNVNELASNALGSTGSTSSRLTLGRSGGAGQGSFTSFGSSGQSSISSSSQGSGRPGPFTNLGDSQQGDVGRQGTFATFANLGASEQSPPRATSRAQSSFTNFANPGSAHQQSILGSSPAKQQTFSTFANVGENQHSFGSFRGTQSSFTNFANPGSTHQQSILGSLPSGQTFDNPVSRQQESILNSSPSLQTFANQGSPVRVVDRQLSSSTFRNLGPVHTSTRSFSQAGSSSLTSFTNLGSGQQSALGPSRPSTFSTFQNTGGNQQGSLEPLRPVLSAEVSSRASFTTFSDPGHIQQENVGPLLPNEFTSSFLGSSRPLEQGSSSGGGFTSFESGRQNAALIGTGDTFGHQQRSKAFVNFG